jgi:hypothetical protein
MMLGGEACLGGGYAEKVLVEDAWGVGPDEGALDERALDDLAAWA